MSFGDQGEGERNWFQNLFIVVMTHNDMCTCIALTKWDGPVACANVTEKKFKVNVIILRQPNPLWQYQWSNMNTSEFPVARFLLISKK